MMFHQIDPNRTISAGKVEIGAFRTYPEVSSEGKFYHTLPIPNALLAQGYTPPDAGSSGYQTIPLDKIEDFGVHANSYYPLKVSVFKSSSDAKLLGLLWNRYWVNTLSQSPLVSVSIFWNEVVFMPFPRVERGTIVDTVILIRAEHTRPHS